MNYLEHYGLERRLLEDHPTEIHAKRYETVQPQHSWDSPARLTNMVSDFYNAFANLPKAPCLADLVRRIN